MEKVQATTLRMENPTTRPPSGDSSKRPTDLTAQPPVLVQVTFPMHDIQSEWQASSVLEPTAAEDPNEAAFLKELEESLAARRKPKGFLAYFRRCIRENLSEPQPQCHNRQKILRI